MRLQGETRGAYFLIGYTPTVKPHQPPFPHVSRFLGRGGFAQMQSPGIIGTR